MNLESSSFPTVTDTRHVEVNTRTALCSGIPRATSDIVAAREKMRCRKTREIRFQRRFFVVSRSLVRSSSADSGVPTAETSPSLREVELAPRPTRSVCVGAAHMKSAAHAAAGLPIPTGAQGGAEALTGLLEEAANLLGQASGEIADQALGQALQLGTEGEGTLTDAAELLRAALGQADRILSEADELPSGYAPLIENYLRAISYEE